MKNLIILFALAILISSCSQKEETKTVEPSFDLYGTSQMTVINNTDDSVKIEITYYPNIIGGVEIFDSAIAVNDSAIFELNTVGYSYFSLVINDVYYRVLTSFDKEVYAEVISDSVVNFTGDFDSINNYLTNISGSHYSVNTDWIDLVNLTEKPRVTYHELMSLNDEVVLKYQKKLALNASVLPGWYIEIESKRLSVMGAYFKLNSLSYRKRMLGFEDEIPLHYVDSIVKDVPFTDERLMGFNHFNMFYLDYVVHSFNPSTDTSANRFGANYVDSLLAYTVKFIPQPFSDYSLTNRLSMRMHGDASGFKPEWIELVTDTVFKRFLYQKLHTKEVLPKGEKAPNFTVLDMDSNQFSFSKIKDTVVLINFWASYCKPCINNFTHENELVEQYKGEPVKIINLCIESEFSNFLFLVEKHRLKTINIFADEKMSGQLRKDFDIHGIPHSILIDKNSLVVKNKCSVPGDGIVNEIEKLLK